MGMQSFSRNNRERSGEILIRRKTIDLIISFFIPYTICKWKRVSSRRDLHKYISFIPLVIIKITNV